MCCLLNRNPAVGCPKRITQCTPFLQKNGSVTLGFALPIPFQLLTKPDDIFLRTVPAKVRRGEKVSGSWRGASQRVWQLAASQRNPRPAL